jgi:hypothetical protein
VGREDATRRRRGGKEGRWEGGGRGGELSVDLPFFAALSSHATVVCVRTRARKHLRSDLGGGGRVEGLECAPNQSYNECGHDADE